MRKYILALIALLPLGACGSVETRKDPEAGPQDDRIHLNLPVQEEVLPNGMRILIVEKPGAPRVHCSLYWRVGSVHERPGITGLAHFFEHMMFKGTRTIGTRDPDKDADLNDKIEAVMEEVRQLKLRRLERERRGLEPLKVDEERMKELMEEYAQYVKEQQEITISEHLSKLYQANGGTDLNASTSFDRTNYYVELPSNKVELFFWLESDRFRAPVFREFYPEREVVKEERRMRTDSTPTGLIEEAFWAAFWKAHPYSWPVIGWMSDIDQYRLRDAQAYFRTHYSPQNCTAIFVGDIKADEIRSLARRYFGRLERFAEDPDPIVTQEPEQPAPSRMTAEADADNSIQVQWHGPSQVHADAPALDVLAVSLDGLTGRLHKRLVVEKEIALQAGAWYWGMRFGGVLNCNAQPDLEGAQDAEARVAEVEREIYAVLEEIKEKGLMERELEKAKNKLLADLVRQLQANEGISGMLGYYDTVGSWRDLAAWMEGVQAVTNERIQQVARKYFTVNGRNVLVVRRR